MNDIPRDFDLEQYNIHIPKKQIAQYPVKNRSDAKLMVLDRDNNTWEHTNFSYIYKYLPPNSLLVANKTGVFSARLIGQKAWSKGKAEFLLTTPLPMIQAGCREHGWKKAEVSGLIKPVKRLHVGQLIQVAPHLQFRIKSIQEYGQVCVDLFWQGSLADLLQKYGKTPLPPYINRQACQEDQFRYQTVYASQKHAGSVAAPTAGLHFNNRLFDQLQKRNIDWTEVLLHIGYGTFNPIRCRDIRQHDMHSEYFAISEDCAEKIIQAKKSNRPIVAVGTTSVRVLETVFQRYNTIQACTGWTDLFIYPGFRFQVVDHLVTNFHLPKSTLIIMISAFAGRKKILQAYAEAVNRDYRFFSYGDAMLIL